MEEQKEASKPEETPGPFGGGVEPGRDGSGRWTRGFSGNKEGRLRKDYVTRALEKELEKTIEDGKTRAQKIAERLVDIASGEDVHFDEKQARAIVQAAKEVTDRVEGRALQKVEVETGASVGELLEDLWATRRKREGGA